MSGLRTNQALEVGPGNNLRRMASILISSKSIRLAKSGDLAMKVLLFVWMAACIVAAAKATHQQTEIESRNGLGMSIAHDEAASGPYQAMHFKVTFTNLTTEDLTLIPGTLVDCGTAPSKTSAVKLNLTGPEGKQHRHLPYLGDGPPYQGACAGRIELYAVVLHRGESLSLPLDIGKYVDLSDSKQYDSARFAAGKYSLQAELTMELSDTQKSTLKMTNVWTGRAVSNTVQVQFASEFSAPLDDYRR